MHAMEIADKLKTWVADTLHIEGDFAVEHPKDMSHGDYAVNIALIEGKKQGKNPRELANEYMEKLASCVLPEVERMETAGPGFINIHLNREYFASEVGEAVEMGEKFGTNNNLNKQKTIIEYTNCNVLKPMHIGHLMGNIIGESLSRIIEANGAEIKRNTYQGDSGLHIAKVVWGIMKLGGKIEGDLSEKVDYIGKAYALGANSYEEDTQVQEEIKDLNQKIFEKTDANLIDLYEWGRKISLDHFEELYKKLGTKFDYYFFESEVADDALKIVKEFLQKGVFEESQGAVVFKGENYDPKLHTRVFVSSQGLPMYEAKDVAHALRKYKIYTSDKSLILTANEQDGYFKVVLRALQEINSEVAKQTHHLSHGILKLPDGKMSSRKGNVITGETLINDVQELAMEKMSDRDMPDAVKQEVAEIVAIGAIKYSILHQAIGGDIIFDFDKSLSFEGDSGPYLQYAYVRSQSVIKKAVEVGVQVSHSIPDDWQTTTLEKLIARFPEVVARAGAEYAPHYIATYLTELAASFNNFYVAHKIADASDASAGYKLALTEAFGIVMKKGLDLLGIKVPTEM
jgi:arginyl-tRNA synthetase